MCLDKLVFSICCCFGVLGCQQTQDGMPELCKGKPSLCGFYLGQKFNPNDCNIKQKYAICNLKDDSVSWSKRPIWHFDFKPEIRVESCITYKMAVDKKTGRILSVMAKCDDREEKYESRCKRAESMTKALEGRYKGRYNFWKTGEGTENEVSNYEFSDGEYYRYSIRVHDWKFSCVLQCEHYFLEKIEESLGNLMPRVVEIAKERRCDAEWEEIWNNVLDKDGVAEVTTLDKYTFGGSYPDAKTMKYGYVMGFHNIEVLGDPMYGILLTEECDENDKFRCGSLARGLEVAIASVENLYDIRLLCYGDPQQTRWMYRNKNMEVLVMSEKREGKFHASMNIVNLRILKHNK